VTFMIVTIVDLYENACELVEELLSPSVSNVQ
jgi:hypothetical protein